MEAHPDRTSHSPVWILRSCNHAFAHLCSGATFFNYFDSKEDAILGIRDFDVSAEELAEHARAVKSPDAVSAVVSALFYVIGPSITDTAAHQNRLETIRRFPELLSRQMVQMTKMTGQLTGTVQLILSTDPRWRDAADPASAEVMLGLCFSAIRVAVREWIGAGSIGSTQDLEERTLALIRQLTERIA